MFWVLMFDLLTAKPDVMILYSLVMNPLKMTTVVETYVGVCNIDLYVCILSTAFVGYYEHCDNMHGVCNIKSITICS
jgi:hypothetical protein